MAIINMLYVGMCALRARNIVPLKYNFPDNWSRLMDSWIVGFHWCQPLESDVVDLFQPLEIDVNPRVCSVAHFGSPNSMVKGLKFVSGIKAWRSVYLYIRLF
jgi:hypothetical protein